MESERRLRTRKSVSYSQISDEVITPRTRRLLTRKTCNSDDDFEPSTPKKSKTRVSIATTPRTEKRFNQMLETMNQIQITPTKKLSTNTPSKSILKNVLTPKRTNLKRVSLNLQRCDKAFADEKINFTQKLHVSAVPSGCLPCRENEFSDIFNFIYGKLDSRSSGCMYLAGVPGTGKTATVTAVIKHLQQMVDDLELEKFDFININGMKLTEPRQIYVQIVQQLLDKTLVWSQAYETLKKKITSDSSKKKSIVLLVDELDAIYTKRQDVVYNILDLPPKTNSRIIIIAISNTMDLPERILMGRVASRLGLTRLSFQPYTFQQLEQIVINRLEGSKHVFLKEAVQLVARKVAAVSGDARRALDICRRAAEIASMDEKTKTKGNDEVQVSLKHVNQALKEMINCDQVQIIKNLTLIQQLLLRAIVSEILRTGIEETNMDSVLNQFEMVCTIEGLPIVPSTSNVLRTVQYLTKQKIISVEKNNFSILSQLRLNVSQDDIQFALKL